jgi:hypothetical protein
MRWPRFPKLISYLIKWTAIGVAGGLAGLAMFLALDIGGFGSLVWRSSSPGLALYILANSFAVTGATFSVGVAVMLRKDFGGSGGSGNGRLDRWRAGGSAELDPYEDRPLP